MFRRTCQRVASLLSPSDEEAMGRVRADGDARAFALLVDRWELPVRRLCWRMTGDLHRAEDLTQETFAKLYARRVAYRPRAKFSTFLWRVALNLCHDERRRLERRRETPLDEGEGGVFPPPSAAVRPAPDGGHPGASAVAREEAEIVRAALDALPERYRAVVVLRHYEGLKLREIAEVLEVPEGTVCSRLAEALKRLAVALAPVLAVPEGTSRAAGEGRPTAVSPTVEERPLTL